MLRAMLISMLLCFSACASVPEETPSTPAELPYDVIIYPSEDPLPPNCDVPDCVGTSPIQTQFQGPSVNAEEQQRIKYPPLIYGAQKPLICSREYPAKGKLENRPNLQLMWEHYLYERPERVWAEVGGAVEYNGCLPEDKGGWRNACTVRLSHMLNKAGHKVPYLKNQTVSGGSGDQYFYRLDDAQNYLIQTFGAPDIKIDMPGQLFDLPTNPGLFIIKFRGADFTGHATIWNGAGTVDGVDIVGYEISFWELPCFVPPERKATRNDKNLSAVKIPKSP